MPMEARFPIPRRAAVFVIAGRFRLPLGAPLPALRSARRNHTRPPDRILCGPERITFPDAPALPGKPGILPHPSACAIFGRIRVKAPPPFSSAESVISLSGTDARGPLHGGEPAPYGRSKWTFSCGNRVPCCADASWAGMFSAYSSTSCR